MNLLYLEDDFFEERFGDFEKRYEGFGKNIYRLIEMRLPDVYVKLKFYRRARLQPEDSYAQYCGVGKTFGIQLDPLCQVIVLWNNARSIEIGTWSDNAYYEALEWIRAQLL